MQREPHDLVEIQLLKQVLEIHLETLALEVPKRDLREIQTLLVVLEENKKIEVQKSDSQHNRIFLCDIFIDNAIDLCRQFHLIGERDVNQNN